MSLKHLYPQWHANCVESARWLRSGAEYEQWHQKMNMTPLTPEERETKAQEYDTRAARYLDPNYNGA